MTSSTSTRLNEALSLLLQSPPGQTSQVYHDLRGILFDAKSNASDNLNDATLQSAAAVALEEYNTQQLVTANLPSPDDKTPVIICQAGQVAAAASADGVKRYLHPKLGKTFAFDHVKRTVSDVKEASSGNVDAEAEKTRTALEKVLDEYVRDRYPDGVSSVFAVPSVPVKDESELKEEVEKAALEDAKTPAENTAAVVGDEASAAEAKEPTKDGDDEMNDDPVEAAKAAEDVASSASASKPDPTPIKTTFTIHHVGNRFNLSNFWSGRWRASYHLDPTSSPPTLTSSLSVQVHYFENGNVQLNAAKPRTFHLSGSGDAEKLAKEVVGVIGAHEDAWQKGLETTYDELAERAFKALRRQLPLTRQKVDWDKVLNYKLGDELARG